MLVRRLLTMGMIIALAVGCSSKEEKQVEVTPTIIFEPISKDVEQNDVYIYLISVAKVDINADFYYHRFHVETGKLMNPFHGPDEWDDDTDYCSQYIDKFGNDGGARSTTCTYVLYSKESEEQAKKAEMNIKLYDYEGNLLYDSNKAILNDFVFVDDSDAE